MVLDILLAVDAQRAGDFNNYQLEETGVPKLNKKSIVFNENLQRYGHCIAIL